MKGSAKLLGGAASAIKSHIEKEEIVDLQYGWNFLEGIADRGIVLGAGYSVTIFSTAYDNVERKQLFLSVRANVDENNHIAVSTVKRCQVDDRTKQYF